MLRAVAATMSTWVQTIWIDVDGGDGGSDDDVDEEVEERNKIETPIHSSIITAPTRLGPQVFSTPTLHLLFVCRWVCVCQCKFILFFLLCVFYYYCTAVAAADATLKYEVSVCSICIVGVVVVVWYGCLLATSNCSYSTHTYGRVVCHTAEWYISRKTTILCITFHTSSDCV